jgi:ABC-type amino acid transport substrate-binding protein
MVPSTVDELHGRFHQKVYRMNLFRDYATAKLTPHLEKHPILSWLAIGALLSIFLVVLPGCSDGADLSDVSDAGNGEVRVSAADENSELNESGRDFQDAFDISSIVGSDGKATLETIRRRGTLRVGMRVKTGVYVPGTQAARGFHYELAERLAGLIGVDLSITIVEGISDYFDLDAIGATPETADKESLRLPIDVDIYADIITILPEREELVDFVPMIPVRQLVITRHGEEIESLSELEDRVVAMVRGSSYESQVARYGQTLNFVPQMLYVASTADMVRAVVDGTADVTLQDSVLGFDIIRDYPKLHLGRPLGEVQFLGWGLARGDAGMKDLVSSFIHLARESGAWEELWIESNETGYLDYLALMGI